MRKGKPSFFRSYLDDQRSTNDTLDVLRRLHHSTSALEHSIADQEYEADHGPRTPSQKLRLGLSRFIDAIGFEASLLGVVILKLLLIIVFNVIGFALLFWMLSVLL